ncbi:MAG: hypothetical protein ACKVOW_06825 [Chitinophagaceae bacterium]
MSNRFLKLITLSILPFFSLKSVAQQFEFLPSFDSVSSNSFFYLAGKVGKNNLVIKARSNDLPQVMVCDSSGIVIEQKTLPVSQLSPKASIAFSISGDKCTVIIQHPKDSFLHLGMIQIDERGDLINPYTVLDSTIVQTDNASIFYQLYNKSEQENILLYRMIFDADENKLAFDYIAINTRGEKETKKTHYLPFNDQEEEVIPVYRNDDKNIVVGIYDKLPNKLSDYALTLYRFQIGSDNFESKVINYKKKQPNQPFFVRGSAMATIRIGSLYKDSKEDKYLGVILASVIIKKEKMDASLSELPFSKDLMSQLYRSKKNLSGIRKLDSSLLIIQNSSWSEKENSLLLFIEKSHYKQMRVRDLPLEYEPSLGSNANIGTNTNGGSNSSPSMQFDAIRYRENVLEMARNPNPNGIYYDPTQYLGAGNSSPQTPFSGGFDLPFYDTPKEVVMVQEQYLFQQKGKSIQSVVGKLTSIFPEKQLSLSTSSFVTADEHILLAYEYPTNGRFIIQSLSTNRAPANYIVGYPVENTLFYNGQIRHAGKRKLVTFYVNGSTNRIGLAVISLL